MCTLAAYADYKRVRAKKDQRRLRLDTTRGIKLFADQAFFAVGGGDIARSF